MDASKAAIYPGAPDGYSIRDMVTADADVVTDLMSSEIPGQDDWEGTRKVIQSGMMRGVGVPPGGVFVCLSAVHDASGEVVGAVMAHPLLGTLARLINSQAEASRVRDVLTCVKIHCIAVRPEHRGTGLGSMLLKLAADMSGERGGWQMFGQIDAEDSALAQWYAGRGFEVLEQDRRIAADRSETVILAPLPGERHILRNLGASGAS